MFYSITGAGALLADWARSQHDELMIQCARIGFKP